MFDIVYKIVGFLTTVFFVIFSLYVWKEKHKISALKLLIFGVIVGFYWFISANIFYNLVWINLSILIVFVILFFLPIGKSKPIRIIVKKHKGEKVDERDTMFARAEYVPGTKIYNEYYSNKPESKTKDDKIRSLPKLLSEGGKFYDPIKSRYVRALFKIEEHRIDEVDGDVDPDKIDLDKTEATKIIKELCLHQGAVDVGIAELNQNYVYSHQARGTDEWGTPINNTHKYVIAFAVEMNYEKVFEAPKIGITEETAHQYLQAQRISIAIAKFIRELGYSARAHISGSNYQIILPAVAYDAGLGELSRMNYLISKKYGARVRLGAVTTDLELNTDKPVNLGVQDFCNKCKKCAYNCPSKSISLDDKKIIRGVEKWEFNIENCYLYWRYYGTDCGLCMKVCPFSHPNNWVHNLIRFGIKNSAFARQISLWGDDLIYGKKLKVKL